MAAGDFKAYAYFAHGGRFKYAAPSLEDALSRAQFWYDLFILEWGGHSVEGDEVTSICVRKPCGSEIELMRKSR